MTPEQRKATAQARTKAREDEAREQAKTALQRKQAKLRATTKRDSAMPRGKP